MAIFNDPAMFDQIRHILTSPHERVRPPRIRQRIHRDDEVREQQVVIEYRRFDTRFEYSREDLAAAVEGATISFNDFADRLREFGSIELPEEDLPVTLREARSLSGDVVDRLRVHYLRELALPDTRPLESEYFWDAFEVNQDEVSAILKSAFESRYPNHKPSCTTCKYWAGDLLLPCGVQPEGFEGDECSDFEVKD